MDTVKCRALLEALRLGSFSAAAEKLGYTASGLAKIINSVEKELGVDIVKRTNRGIELTEDGKLMMPVIQSLANDHERAFQISSQIKGLTVGTINIGAYYSIAASWLPEIVKVFKEKYPKVNINIKEGYTREVFEWLELGQIDCAFVNIDSYDKGDKIFLKSDEIMAWLPREHPLASAESYPLHALGEETFIYCRPGLDNEVDKLCEKHDIKLDVGFYTRDLFTAYQMVSKGLGISCENKLVAENWGGDVVLKSFDEKQFCRFGIVIPNLANITPATRRLVNIAKKLYHE